MKSKFNMENLTKPELLMLFSILEGELEARDVVIEALKAQRKELFIQERYGKYNLSDPFQALQRDGDIIGGPGREPGHLSPTSNPLVVLKLVVSHCRRMQEKMLAQLAAAESRHRRVIADLEEEKRRHAEDTAEGDDVTYILEKERERLHQQLEFERSQVRRLEKEQRQMVERLEDERAQHKQLSCALAKECKWASTRALEEGHRLTELSRKLDKEKEACQALRKELEEEQMRALRMEARVEEQLAEFDTEREQLRSRLKKEEAHCSQLRQQAEELRSELKEAHMLMEGGAAKMASASEWASKVPSVSASVDDMKVVDFEEDTERPPAQPRVNGHHGPPGEPQSSSGSEKTFLQNGAESRPAHQAPAPSCCGSSSPCSSPVLLKRPAGGASPGGFQSSYQSGINQRFHAARHRFQGATELDPPQPLQAAAASPPARDAPPAPCCPAPEAGSPVKQLARSTVTQVLSRFTTVQQSAAAKTPTTNCSPFGTDYRSLATPLSPTWATAGVRSPTIARGDRSLPPPIPPKKPGLAQAPQSLTAAPKSAKHFPESPLSGSCGLSSAQEGVKELDVVVSSN